LRAYIGFLKGIRPLVLLIACSCSPPSSNPNPGSGDTGSLGGSGSEVESLFVPSIDGSGAAFFDFETSDSAYLGDKGYTLWAFKAEPQAPFTSRTVSVDKLSGNPAAGFGIVFCRQPSFSGETMLVAMINAQQEYIVGEARGSIFTEIGPWTHSTYLKQGYNQTNILGLSLDAATRKFTLSLNGNPVPAFSALEPGYPLSGDNGYIAVISPFEKFPANPVRITYKE
jgi:hypothetical protein